MQTVKDYLRESIKHTLISVGESVLKEEKILNDFIKKHKVDIKYLRKNVEPPVKSGEYNRYVIKNVPIPTKVEAEILYVISNYSFTPIDEILSRSRKTEAVNARRVYAVILYLYLNYNLSEAGRRLGRDHTTIIHSLRTHDALLESDPRYLRMYSNVFDEIKQHLPSDYFVVETSELKNFNKELTRMKWEKLTEFHRLKRKQSKEVNNEEANQHT